MCVVETVSKRRKIQFNCEKITIARFEWMNFIIITWRAWLRNLLLFTRADLVGWARVLTHCYARVYIAESAHRGV